MDEFEELRREEVAKEYEQEESPYITTAGEFARFMGMVGIAAMLWLCVYIVGPDASRILSQWMH